MPDGTFNIKDIYYQWQYLSENSWINIAEKTSKSLHIPNHYRDKSLRVVTTYTDDQGYINTTISTPSQPIGARDWGTGKVESFSGLHIEGETIQAGNIIDDPDGDASNPNYFYNWYVKKTGSHVWDQVNHENGRPVHLNSINIGNQDAGNVYKLRSFDDARGLERKSNQARANQFKLKTMDMAPQ